MRRVVISILNYNNSRDTVECLDSILRQNLTGLELTTYVLDNGSQEIFEVDTSKYLKINLTVISSRKNTGFTGGHNLVYREAEKPFDYFMILNNDCVLDKESLGKLIAHMHGNVGAVVPKIYFTKGHEYHKNRYKKDDLGKIIWYAGGEIDWKNIVSKHFGLDEVDKGQFDEEKNITFATGACVVFKNEVIKKVGFFDNRFFLYYEDADLSVRINKNGYGMLYVPEAVVWHNNAGSSGSGSSLHDYYLTRNKLIFGMKHASLRMKAFLTKEAVLLLLSGRKWQKRGVADFYLRRFGKGSYHG